MLIPVLMPQMGESLSEGTVSRWLKKEGERVEKDEPLFEITTDKVDTEVPSPASGTLQQILIWEGETVLVGTAIARIESVAVGKAAGRPASEDTATSPPHSAPVDSGGGHFRSAHEPTTFKRPSPRRPVESRPPPESGRSGNTLLSPAVLSLAAQTHIPLPEILQVQGTGSGGRITKKDVERYLDARGRGAMAPAFSGPVRAAATPDTAPPPEYLYRPQPGDTLVPMSTMRRKIAEHMIWSQRISAQVTSFTACDMSRIVKYREERKEAFEAAEGAPLTMLAFVADATLKALKQFPLLNASVVDDRIVLKKHIHLGIAVALDEGLIVPVIRNAEEMSLVGLARAIHDIAARARGKQLSVEEVQGATFTVTNPGMFGGLTGTPIISQPQVAILGIGAIQKKPVVIDDAIAIRSIMVLALTFDHRIIDGATGFQFLEHVRASLESAQGP